MLPAEIAKARAIESSRPLKERLADEATTEPVASTFQEWLTHPNELDLPRVDVKSPLTFNKEEYFSRRGWVDGKVEAFEDGEYVGHIGYTWTPCDFHIELVHVKPEHRGKGYAAFMLREVINQQDKLCIPATLEAQPFAGEPVPSRAAERNQMGVLKELYGSFGFEPHIGNTKMTRMPVCRTKREKDRLMRECEGKIPGDW
jgi:GNAT superfamily N-acetyltransferase